MFAIGFPGEHQGFEEVLAEDVTDDFGVALDNLIDAMEWSKQDPLWFGARLMLLVLQNDGTTRWEVLGDVKEDSE